jgi:Predicted permease
MHVLDVTGRSLADGGGMFWQMLWALVLGFGLSGAVQAFVSRAQMQRVLGDHRPGTIARAGFFGAASSSCSYAASALAKTLFARGADFTTAQAFMFASTNLVTELGVVLWLLIGTASGQHWRTSSSARSSRSSASCARSATSPSPQRCGLAGSPSAAWSRSCSPISSHPPAHPG